MVDDIEIMGYQNLLTAVFAKVDFSGKESPTKNFEFEEQLHKTPEEFYRTQTYHSDATVSSQPTAVLSAVQYERQEMNVEVLTSPEQVEGTKYDGNGYGPYCLGRISKDLSYILSNWGSLDDTIFAELIKVYPALVKTDIRLIKDGDQSTLIVIFGNSQDIAHLSPK